MVILEKKMIVSTTNTRPGTVGLGYRRVRLGNTDFGLKYDKLKRHPPDAFGIDIYNFDIQLIRTCLDVATRILC